MSALARGRSYGEEITAARPRRGMAGQPRKGDAGPRAEPARGYELSGALHRTRIHLDLSGDGTAGFRPPRDRLCAGTLAAGVEIVKTLCRELPQSRRLP